MRYPNGSQTFRFSLRTLFAVTTIFALFCFGWNWMEQRRDDFLEKAALHKSRCIYGCYLPSLDPQIADQDDAYQKFQHQMAEKYSLAAKRPWMIVEADPMEPPASEDMLQAIKPAEPR
jgi:hypothetical protein